MAPVALFSNSDTLVAQLTPPGLSAIAVVAVWGPAATHLCAGRFTAASGQPLSNLSGRPLFGIWRSSEDLAEEVVVARRSDADIEVHCHGGIAAVRAIIDSLVRQGGREVAAADLWRHIDGDSIRCDAALLLSQARTERTTAILLDQYRGALRRELTEIANLLAAPPDHAEAAHHEARQRIARLRQRAVLGRHLTEPWRVVVAGRPNVGKSSLCNALLGYARSIVFPAPGTTRDVISAVTAFDGWPVEIVDTAGLRAAAEAIEQQGVARARAEVERADLVLHVRDATALDHDDELPRRPDTPVVTVLNKWDLVASAAQPTGARPTGARPPDQPIPVSALSGYGLIELQQHLVTALIPDPPQPGAPVPFTAAQLAYLDSLD